MEVSGGKKRPRVQSGTAAVAVPEPVDPQQALEAARQKKRRRLKNKKRNRQKKLRGGASQTPSGAGDEEKRVPPREAALQYLRNWARREQLAKAAKQSGSEVTPWKFKVCLSWQCADCVVPIVISSVHAEEEADLDSATHL